MTKEQVLEYISAMDWQKDSWKKTEEQAKIECSIAKYVVYQENMDTYNVYSHEYYMTQEEALADFESRTSSDTCYCVVAEMNGSFRKKRTIYDPLARWN